LIGVNNGEDSLLDTGNSLKKALAAAKPDKLAEVQKLYGPGTTPEMALRHQLTDGLAAAPARWVATQWSRRAPVYLYRFEHVDEWRRPKRTRAAHGAEVFYVFKTLDRKLDDPPSPTAGDEKVAAEVHARWVAFAKTGSPNVVGLPTWPTYSPQSDPWLVFGQKETGVQHHLLKPQLDWYDDQIVPMLWLFRAKSWWDRHF
jgi:para-nitrobenzyl esterase